MLILMIAAGIVLGVICLRFLPQVLILAAVGAAVFVVVVVSFIDLPLVKTLGVILGFWAVAELFFNFLRRRRRLKK